MREGPVGANLTLEQGLGPAQGSGVEARACPDTLKQRGLRLVQPQPGLSRPTVVQQEIGHRHGLSHGLGMARRQARPRDVQRATIDGFSLRLPVQSRQSQGVAVEGGENVGAVSPYGRLQRRKGANEEGLGLRVLVLIAQNQGQVGKGDAGEGMVRSRDLHQQICGAPEYGIGLRRPPGHTKVPAQIGQALGQKLIIAGAFGYAHRAAIDRLSGVLAPPTPQDVAQIRQGDGYIGMVRPERGLIDRQGVAVGPVRLVIPSLRLQADRQLVQGVGGQRIRVAQMLAAQGQSPPRMTFGFFRPAQKIENARTVIGQRRLSRPVQGGAGL